MQKMSSHFLAQNIIFKEQWSNSGYKNVKALIFHLPKICKENMVL